MAKQRGIHQISGKINNLCYYEQKYVRGGLIRRINEAMSERLKTDPVFNNTRRANTIFGGCSMFARQILNCFSIRNSFLFKPYRQSLLTKAVKENLTYVSSNIYYPDIGVRNMMDTRLSNVIESIVKNKLSTSFPEIPKYAGRVSLESTYEFVFSQQSLLNFCQKYKCIGVQIKISVPFGIYALMYDDVVGKYIQTEPVGSGRESLFNWYSDNESDDLTLSVSTGSIDDAATFWIVYAQPILSVKQNRPVLGETGACSGIVTFIGE